MITMSGKHSVFLNELLKNTETNRLINEALSTYPLYTPLKTYDLIPTREALNKKLLNHYKYREIGFETVGRFIDELEITMNEIMPRYNELFKTVETMAELPNPFDNVDVTETYKETRTDNSSSSGTTTSNTSSEGSTTTSNSSEASGTDTSNGSETGTRDHTRLFSDTPQNSVDNINNYLTDHTKEDTSTSNKTNSSTTNESTSSSEGSESNTASSEGTETSNTSSEGTTTIEHTYTKQGNQGVNTYAHDMNEFRTSIIDVVDQIINDVRVAELFMMVY